MAPKRRGGSLGRPRSSTSVRIVEPGESPDPARDEAGDTAASVATGGLSDLQSAKKASLGGQKRASEDPKGGRQTFLRTSALEPENDTALGSLQTHTGKRGGLLHTGDVGTRVATMHKRPEIKQYDMGDETSDSSNEPSEQQEASDRQPSRSPSPSDDGAGGAPPVLSSLLGELVGLGGGAGEAQKDPWGLIGPHTTLHQTELHDDRFKKSWTPSLHQFRRQAENAAKQVEKVAPGVFKSPGGLFTLSVQVDRDVLRQGVCPVCPGPVLVLYAFYANLYAVLEGQDRADHKPESLFKVPLPAEAAWGWREARNFLLDFGIVTGSVKAGRVSLANALACFQHASGPRRRLDCEQFLEFLLLLAAEMHPSLDRYRVEQARHFAKELGLSDAKVKHQLLEAYATHSRNFDELTDPHETFPRLEKLAMKGTAQLRPPRGQHVPTAEMTGDKDARKYMRGLLEHARKPAWTALPAPVLDLGPVQVGTTRRALVEVRNVGWEPVTFALQVPPDLPLLAVVRETGNGESVVRGNKVQYEFSSTSLDVREFMGSVTIVAHGPGPDRGGPPGQMWQHADSLSLPVYLRTLDAEASEAQRTYPLYARREVMTEAIERQSKARSRPGRIPAAPRTGPAGSAKVHIFADQRDGTLHPGLAFDEFTTEAPAHRCVDDPQQGFAMLRRGGPCPNAGPRLYPPPGTRPRPKSASIGPAPVPPTLSGQRLWYGEPPRKVGKGDPHKLRRGLVQVPSRSCAALPSPPLEPQLVGARAHTEGMLEMLEATETARLRAEPRHGRAAWADSHGTPLEVARHALPAGRLLDELGTDHGPIPRGALGARHVRVDHRRPRSALTGNVPKKAHQRPLQHMGGLHEWASLAVT